MLSKQQGWDLFPASISIQLFARKQQLLELQNNSWEKSHGHPLSPRPAGEDGRGGAGQAWGSPSVPPSHTSLQSQRHTKVLAI